MNDKEKAAILEKILKFYITHDGGSTEKSAVVLPGGFTSYDDLYVFLYQSMRALHGKKNGSAETTFLKTAWIDTREALLGEDGAGGQYGRLSETMMDFFRTLLYIGPDRQPQTPGKSKRHQQGKRSDDQDMLFHLFYVEGGHWQVEGGANGHFHRGASVIVKALEACLGRRDCYVAFIEVIYEKYLRGKATQDQWRNLAGLVNVNCGRKFGNGQLHGEKLFQLQKGVVLAFFRKIFGSDEFDGLVTQLHERRKFSTDMHYSLMKIPEKSDLTDYEKASKTNLMQVHFKQVSLEPPTESVTKMVTWWKEFGEEGVELTTEFGSGTEEIGMTVNKTGLFACIHLFCQKEGAACTAVREFLSRDGDNPSGWTSLSEPLKHVPSSSFEKALCGSHLCVEDVDIYWHLGGTHAPVVLAQLRNTKTLVVLKSSLHAISKLLKTAKDEICTGSMVPREGGNPLLGYFLLPDWLGSDWQNNQTVNLMTVSKFCPSDLVAYANQLVQIPDSAQRRLDQEAYLAKIRYIFERTRDLMVVLVNTVITLDENGVTHQDIKNSNVLVDEDENFKLTDFGDAVEVKADSLEKTTSRLSEYTGSSLYSPLFPTGDEALLDQILRKRDYHSSGVTGLSFLLGNKLTTSDFNKQFTKKEKILHKLEKDYKSLRDHEKAYMNALVALIYKLISLKLGRRTTRTAIDLFQQAFTFAEQGLFEQSKDACDKIYLLDESNDGMVRSLVDLPAGTVQETNEEDEDDKADSSDHGGTETTPRVEDESVPSTAMNNQTTASTTVTDDEKDVDETGETKTTSGADDSLIPKTDYSTAAEDEQDGDTIGGGLEDGKSDELQIGNKAAGVQRKNHGAKIQGGEPLGKDQTIDRTAVKGSEDESNLKNDGIPKDESTKASDGDIGNHTIAVPHEVGKTRMSFKKKLLLLIFAVVSIAAVVVMTADCSKKVGIDWTTKHMCLSKELISNKFYSLKQAKMGEGEKDGFISVISENGKKKLSNISRQARNAVSELSSWFQSWKSSDDLHERVEDEESPEESRLSLTVKEYLFGKGKDDGDDPEL